MIHDLNWIYRGKLYQKLKLIMDQIIKYRAKGKTISRSLHHLNLWIIDYDSGGFATLTASEDIMKTINPPVSNIKYGAARQLLSL